MKKFFKTAIAIAPLLIASERFAPFGSAGHYP